MKDNPITLESIAEFLENNRRLRNLPSDSQLKEILTVLRIPGQGNSKAIELIKKFARIYVETRPEKDQTPKPKPMVKHEWSTDVTWSVMGPEPVNFSELMISLINNLGLEAPESIEYFIHSLIVTRNNKSAAKVWRRK